MEKWDMVRVFVHASPPGSAAPRRGREEASLLSAVLWV